MADDNREVTVLSRSEIHNEIAHEGSCTKLTEVISKQEMVPAEDIPIQVPHFIYTDFYCEIDGRKFSTLVNNWEGDKREGHYRQIGLRIAKSIRLMQDHR